MDGGTGHRRPCFDCERLCDCDLDDASSRLTRAFGYKALEGCAVSGNSPSITDFSQAGMLQSSDVRLKVRLD